MLKRGSIIYSSLVGGRVGKSGVSHGKGEGEDRVVHAGVNFVL